MEILDTPDQTSLDENLAAIRDFAGRHSDLNPVMTLVPNSAYILTQYVPTNAPVRDQAADIAYAPAAPLRHCRSAWVSTPPARIIRFIR